MTGVTEFRKPSPVERLFNRAFGLLVGLGLGTADYYLLQVRGRKTGRIYSTPVNVITVGGARFLVAPRGRTQWVRNAEAAGEVVLKRGWGRRRFHIRAVPNSHRPDVLCAYLNRFRVTVQRYFPVRAGAVAAEFVPIVDRYPVFELLEKERPGGTAT